MAVKSSRKVWGVITALGFCLTCISPCVAQANLALAEEAAPPATTVQVVNPAGSTLTMSADKPLLEALPGTSGSISFDAETGTVTVDNATGFQRIRATSGSLTVILKGASTMNCAGGNNVLAAQNGSLTIKGDGSLKFSCLAQAISAKNDITIEGGIKLEGTVTTAKQPVIYTTGGNVQVRDSAEAVLETPSGGCGIQSNNPADAGVYISGDARVSITGAGDYGIRVGVNKGAGTSATLSITGNAIVGLEASQRAIFINQYSSNVFVRGNAALTAKSTVNNTIWLNGLGPACLEISENATADISATGSGAAINLLGYGANKLSITTKNTVDVAAAAPGGKNNVWGAISMWATQAGNQNTVLIQDAKLNVTNTLDKDTTGSNATALYVTGKPGSSLKIGGNAQVSLTAVNNSSGSSVCEAVGLWVTPGVEAVIQDKAKLTAVGGGTAAASTNRGGGIYLGSSLWVSDSAEVIAQAKGNASSGILLDSASQRAALTLTDRAVLQAASEKENGINAYNDTVNSSAISLLGGTLTAAGVKAGLGSASSNMGFDLADNAVIKAGEDADSITTVEKPDFTSRYLLMEIERVKINELSYTGFTEPTEGTVITDNFAQDIAGALKAAEGVSYRLDTSAAVLQRLNGTNWTSVAAGGTIAGGEYRFIVRAKIDGENGITHVLSQNAVMRVDGTEWTPIRTEIGNDYSWGEFAVNFTVEHINHTGGEATCSAKAICSICYQPYGELDESNHKNTELRGAQPATEEAEGYTGDTWCKDCNKKIAEGEVIDKLLHTHSMKKTEEKQPTCTQDGNKAYYTCEKCGKLYQDIEGRVELQPEDVVIAAGHVYGSDWKYDAENHWHECSCGDKADVEAHEVEVRNAKEAKPGEKGYTGDKVCKVCGYIVEAGKEIPAKEAENDIPQTDAAGGVVGGLALVIMLGAALVVLRCRRNILLK